MSNMTDEQSQLIEHVNKRAGCIISGAIRGTSSSVLFEELSWVSMETRRKHHRMYAFHKIVLNLSPPYLRNCIPSYVRDSSSYQLRDADEQGTIPCRLDLFHKSFFSSGGSWVELASTWIVKIPDHKKFKIALQKSLPVSNKLYSYGRRKCSIIHSRLRMGCSELNAHLYNYQVIENPKCPCRDDYEDSFHYFLYVQQFLWNAMCY